MLARPCLQCQLPTPCLHLYAWYQLAAFPPSNLPLMPRAALSKALVVTARRWASVVAPEEANRLTPVVESLSQRWVVYQRNGRKVIIGRECWGLQEITSDTVVAVHQLLLTWQGC